MNEYERTVERLIDKTDVATLLNTIAQICTEKSQHLLSEYQDKRAAQLWGEYTKHCYRAALNCSKVK